MKSSKTHNKIPLKEAIEHVKKALLYTRDSEFYVSYQNYIHISANRCLDQMLLDYSFEMLREKAARRIQGRWLKEYYNPYRPICKRRIMRQFEALTKNDS